MTGAPTIPVDIVGGFLGSGKTTLLRRLLEQGTGERVAVVVNEFGEIGIDGVLAEPIGRDQIVAADFLVLSKLDLPETRGLPAAEGRLRVVNARAPVISAPVGNDGLQLLFGSGLPPAVDDRAARRAEAPA